MDNKKLRKRDRVLNLVKAGAKRTHKGFQKVQPVVKKVKVIVNPRNALLGFLFMSILHSSALAAPNPIPDVEGLIHELDRVRLYLIQLLLDNKYLRCLLYDPW
jgi:hypothetical protein